MIEPGLKLLTSEVTSSATQLFKRFYKISHPPGLQASVDALPTFAASSKIENDFSNKVVLKGIEVTKNHVNKKCAIENSL